jgi:hypothetical protein
MPLQNPSHLAAIVNQGLYTGNDTVNRAIAHGLPTTPKVVLFFTSTERFGVIMRDFGEVMNVNSGGVIAHATVASSSTNFYVGNVADYPQSMNASGTTYKWVAFA